MVTNGLNEAKNRSQEKYQESGDYRKKETNNRALAEIRSHRAGKKGASAARKKRTSRS
jgi:hypothetical protein